MAEARGSLPAETNFEISSQSISALVFFCALGLYKDRDVAMALALCLEAALYWHLHADLRQLSTSVAIAKAPRPSDVTSSEAAADELPTEEIAEEGTESLDGRGQLPIPVREHKALDNPTRSFSEGIRIRAHAKSRALEGIAQLDEGGNLPPAVSPAGPPLGTEPSQSPRDRVATLPHQRQTEADAEPARADAGAGDSDIDAKLRQVPAEISAGRVDRPEREAVSSPSPQAPQQGKEPSTLSVARPFSTSPQESAAAGPGSISARRQPSDVALQHAADSYSLPKTQPASLLQPEKAVSRSRGRPPKGYSGGNGAPGVGVRSSSEKEAARGETQGGGIEASTASQDTVKRKAESGGSKTWKRVKTEPTWPTNASPGTGQEPFNPKKVKANMTVLLRTEPDENEQWDRVWSLGRVIYVSKGTLAVTWLKPEGFVAGAGLWDLPWKPWQIDQGPGGKGSSYLWQTKGVDLETVQWGMPALPFSGYIPQAYRATLAAEVARLEAAANVKRNDHKSEHRKASHIAASAARKNCTMILPTA